jgi:hypothetical protein
MERLGLERGTIDNQQSGGDRVLELRDGFRFRDPHQGLDREVEAL